VAGPNQHNIPQALLRGFRIPGSSNKDSKTWLYEKGIEPRPEFIKDEVAVERHFYSEPSSDDVVEEPACRYVRERFWDGYDWRYRRVEICN
jgi:hypothetical protein